MQKFECQICRLHKNADEIIPLSLVRPAVVESLKKDFPDWNPDGYICLPDLSIYRNRAFLQMVESEKGELSHLEEQVARSLHDQEILSRNLNEEYEERTSLGARAADVVASFGGSWRFVILFGVFMLVWITTNAAWLLKEPFDPYPFILLNLAVRNDGIAVSNDNNPDDGIHITLLTHATEDKNHPENLNRSRDCPLTSLSLIALSASAMAASWFAAETDPSLVNSTARVAFSLYKVRYSILASHVQNNQRQHNFNPNR